MAVVTCDMATAIKERLFVEHVETHVDGRRIAILVFDFGLGQGRSAVAAPVNGLESLV